MSLHLNGNYVRNVAAAGYAGMADYVRHSPYYREGLSYAQARTAEEICLSDVEAGLGRDGAVAVAEGHAALAGVAAAVHQELPHAA